VTYVAMAALSGLWFVLGIALGWRMAFKWMMNPINRGRMRNRVEEDRATLNAAAEWLRDGP